MQSPQARQKKLERKRLRREEKRRRLRSFEPVVESVLLPPMPKMSEVLLDFARPALGIPDDAGPPEVRSCLLFAAVIWNATVSFNGDLARVVRELTPLVMRQLKMSSSEAVSLIEEMSTRKVDVFPDDRRLVMGVETYWEDGEVRILVASAMHEK